MLMVAMRLPELYIADGVVKFEDFARYVNTVEPGIWNYVKSRLFEFWQAITPHIDQEVEKITYAESKRIIEMIDADKLMPPIKHSCPIQSDLPQPHDDGASAALPDRIWDKDLAKHALDELFVHTTNYKSTKNYSELLRFVACFRAYSPFNSMLIHVQMPGAHFVAPPHRWLFEYKHTIKPGARPIVILQPMGPVMFVFDVSDTTPLHDAPPLPKMVTDPFRTDCKCALGTLGSVLYQNAVRDGVRVSFVPRGSQAAGSIQLAETADKMPFQDGVDDNRNPKYVQIPVRYDLLVSDKLSPEAAYATVVHELAHLYCGHLGTPDPLRWPDRGAQSVATREFEAESVNHLVCLRAGLDPHSNEYLNGYLKNDGNIPAISLECIMKAAGLIETMSHGKLKPRPPIKTRT
jgi:hypothetical protein